MKTQAHGTKEMVQTSQRGHLRDTRPLVMVSSVHNDTRYMLHVLLEMWNYRVVEAEGPTDTLTKAESEIPSLILLDTSLPYEEDLEILRRIRGSSDAGKVPVIVLSGFPQTAYRQAAFENGAAGLLVKPLDLDLLEDYLDDYISH